MSKVLPVPANEKQVLKYSFLTTAATYLLTGFHHYYGAVIYATSWRMHVVLHGGIALLLSFLLFFLYFRYKKKVFLILYIAVAFFVFSLVIGLYEGFYNHLVKNILFFSGMKMSTLRILFPLPLYEMPNNFIFESTGILQFFIAALQFHYLRLTFKYLRSSW